MPFLPGHKRGGKGGRRPILLPADLLKVEKLSAEEVRLLISKTGRMTRAELWALVGTDAEHPGNLEASVAERAFGRVWAMAETEGDPRRLEFLLSRLIGKVPDVDPEEDSVGADDLSPKAREALVGALKLAARGA